MKICLEGIEIYSIHSACMYVYVYNITVDYVRLIKCFDIFKEYLYYIIYNLKGKNSNDAVKEVF